MDFDTLSLEEQETLRRYCNYVGASPFMLFAICRNPAQLQKALSFKGSADGQDPLPPKRDTVKREAGSVETQAPISPEEGMRFQDRSRQDQEIIKAFVSHTFSGTPTHDTRFFQPALDQVAGNDLLFGQAKKMANGKPRER